MQDLPANDQVIEQDEWMTLSDFARPFKDNATCSVNSDYDWSLDRRQYSSEVIDEIPNWIKTKKIHILTTCQELNLLIHQHSVLCSTEHMT